MAQTSMSAMPVSLSNLFSQQQQRSLCQRCGNVVYQMEKEGPVKGVYFHRGCFKCCKCNHLLTLKTYFTNGVDVNDKEIYCTIHAPKMQTAGVDAHALGIVNALQATKLVDSRANELNRRGQAPQISLTSLNIMQPMSAQSEFQRKYKQNNSKHHFPAYVVNKKIEKVYKAQEELEKQHREEEDRLLQSFKYEREKLEENLRKEGEQEWEVRLKDLTSKFDQDMAKKTKKLKGVEKKAMTVKYEEEKKELMKSHTIKLKKQKEVATLRLQKKEQEDTAALVQKQSEQMLELLKKKEEEVKMELAREMADSNGDDAEGLNESGEEALQVAMAALSLHPRELPDPHPPTCRKRDLYYDPSFFHELDEEVINVAEREQTTFTSLVKELTQHCLSDLQKARAIFRWITVKDLNVIDFGDETNDDTPMGLLRGIKYGTETYHTLFMRLCSYAGLACVEIKGHSKSVGYEPGMKIRDDTFQNTWNAVLIDGDWWPVQCNWGARHLVLNKDVQEKPREKSNRKQDKIRYQYDEHYFLTDPDEFIQEFWASEPQWQLLERPITLDEFEAMPFVRSVFFHYGLEFDRDLRAVLHTDNKGGTEVKVRVPEEFASDLVFHYQIRFADRERRNETEFRGARLERFVFHSIVDGYALFSVHVPTPAAYFLEVFANKIDDSHKIGDDPNATMMPFRLKCACKFKVVCEELTGKMHPLPNCASGEWGPSKGVRHFGLRPLTHMTGVVSFDNETEVRFKIPRPLHFLCKLRMNGVEDYLLERYVSYSVLSDELTVRCRPPQPGQYGLDIYARPEDAADNHTLAHACKYLLNCTRVSDPIDITVSKVEPSQRMVKERWGPSPLWDEFGLKALSHREPTIEKIDASPLTIEIGLSEALKLSYHMTKEPNEDCRERVVMKENGKKAKFNISLSKPGNYMFSIYARRKKDSESDMMNVYNYMIRYTQEESDSTLKKKNKSKGLFKK